MNNSLVASRVLSTADGDITVVVQRPSSPEIDLSAFEYVITNASCSTVASASFYGVDDVQALLFCLTAVGDYLTRFVPTASFAGLDVTGFPATDLSAKDAWVSSVTIPNS